jgi:hypothetical protein
VRPFTHFNSPTVTNGGAMVPIRGYLNDYFKWQASALETERAAHRGL